MYEQENKLIFVINQAAGVSAIIAFIFPSLIRADLKWTRCFLTLEKLASQGGGGGGRYDFHRIISVICLLFRGQKQNTKHKHIVSIKRLLFIQPGKR